MKFTKITVLAIAALALFSCGRSKLEGSPAVLELLPSEGMVDTTSYLLGVNFGLVIRQHFGELDMSMLRKGMNDALNAKEGKPIDSVFAKQFKIDPSDMNITIDRYLAAMMAYEAALNKEKGDKFRLDYYTANQADSTITGLVYLIHEYGDESLKPVSDRDTVEVNYCGTLIDGTVFDQQEGMVCPLNRVIAGWSEGLKLIGKGGKITLVIPCELGYGNRGPRAVGPNSTLVFDVETVDVRPYVNPEEE